MFPEIDYDKIDHAARARRHYHDDRADEREGPALLEGVQFSVPQGSALEVMAKTSVVERERRRARTVKSYAAKRKALKETIRNPQTSDEARGRAGQTAEAAARREPVARAQPLPDHRPPARRVPQVRAGRNKLREAAMRGDVPGPRQGELVREARMT